MIESYQKWDDAPDDVAEEAGISAWVDNYRRRLHSTAIPGRTGRRDWTLLMAICHLMDDQGDRVVHASYPDLVRVSALTHHTVLSAVISCRTAGFLRVLGYTDTRGRGEARRLWRFTLVPDALAPDDEASHAPTPTPLTRIDDGNLAHDAFGGRRGIKPTELAVLRWLADHPGSSLRDIGASGVAARATCYRAWEKIISHNLGYVDSAGYCMLVDGSEEALLGDVVVRELLQGAMERRVHFATGPEELWRRGQAGHWGMPR